MVQLCSCYLHTNQEIADQLAHKRMISVFLNTAGGPIFAYLHQFNRSSLILVSKLLCIQVGTVGEIFTKKFNFKLFPVNKCVLPKGFIETLKCYR